ncbi:MAG: hypothetical protein ABIT38_23330, partial [Gemmatimonadaceae bacterium]
MSHRLVAAALLFAAASAPLVGQSTPLSPNAGSARPRGTLVVSNMNDNTATILDAATGTVHATLPTGEGPHEVTISHDGKWALVSNYGVRGKPGNTITVIDVARAAVARTLTLNGYQRPHGMSFLPGDTIAAVTSEVAQAVLFVDVRDGRVVDTLGTRGRASHMVALTADGRRVFTSNIADNAISALDTKRVDSARVMPVARTPEGIAVTPDGKSVWVGSNRDSVVLVMDPASGVALDTLRGFGLPYRIGISPDGRTAVISDPVKSVVRVFSVSDRKERFNIKIPRDSLVATAEVEGSPSPEGVAISRDGAWAFVTLQGRNRVITIDLKRGVIVAYAPTGTWSDGIG